MAFVMLLKTPVFFLTTRNDTDWVTLVFIIILILLTILFTLNRRKYSLLLRSLYSSKFFTQLSHEGKIFQERIYLLDLGVILLTQSLLCYYIVKNIFPSTYAIFSPIYLYFIVLGVVIGDYIFKSLMTFLFTYLYDIREERQTFFSYKLFTQSINSLILLPILIAAVYTAYYPILFLYLPVFIINFMIMAYRLFILNVKRVHPFHFFVYFCTFEILPYLIALKVLLIIEGQAF